ncbi:MAG: acyl-CoA synthetase, partial [Actinobacteria bacterium]
MAADAGPDIRSAYDRSRGRGAAIFCEPLVKNWLRERGIPVPEGGLVENSREALTLASRLSYPLVLKVVSDRVLHKTELGGVVLGIDSPAALGTAYEALEREARQAVEGYAGILLEEQAPTGTEIIVGLQNDPHFGPVLMVGTGGIYSDLLEDVAFRMLPVTRRDIEEMLGGLKGKPLLEGFRANPPADIEALVEVILGLARFGAEIAPYFASADFNPVIAFPQGALVVDAKVVLSEEVSSHPFGFEPPSTRYLEGFFAPESVAVVGASASEGKIGNVIVDSLINYDFKGRIYPINPNREEIMGVRCYPSLDALPESPQLVVMVIDLKEGPDLMRKLADLGVHNLLIVSGGGRELGGERQLIEEEMARLARELDIRVVGPNCIGSFDGKTRFDSFFHSHQRLLRPPSGPLSFITQSGTYGCAFLENAAVVGVAKMVSYGNRLDVDEGDLIAFLSQDPDTRVIGSYIEGLSRGRKYVAAAKEAVYGRKKPVVAFKTGRTRRSAQATVSHTGAYGGTYRVYEGVLEQA